MYGGMIIAEPKEDTHPVSPGLWSKTSHGAPVNCLMQMYISVTSLVGS